MSGKLNARTSGAATGSTATDYKRCVIYTRKSSEEGLEQDFNSLHAQREACEAYIQSQRHEGWRLLRDDAHDYDDGGLSGGTMDRPALQRMLAAIEAGEIDVIVVYKVDRLTRSLADFARIVDVMDKHSVSFVSVTQAFNTTSSMGRLTLNVLLSFAQFEREVTAERIRDKIAASKRKGIWMGGPVPLGYRVEDRRLVVDDGEATIVQRVFETYLRTSSLNRTKAELDADGIRSRTRKGKDGSALGGIPFSHGALSNLLRNPVYIGKTRHKGEVFEGQHDGIIDPALFDAVQAKLAASPGGNKIRNNNIATGLEPVAGRLLTGRLFDSGGFLMSPTHTNKKGARYRYYVSTSLAQHRSKEVSGPHRVSAAKLEDAVIKAIVPMKLNNNHALEPLSDFQQLTCVKRVDILPDGVKITLKPGLLSVDRPQASQSIRQNTLHVPVDWHRAMRCETKLPAKDAVSQKAALLEGRKQRANQTLLRAIATAHRRYDRIKNGDVNSIADLASEESCSVRSIRLNLTLAWLAPDIIQAAIDNKLDSYISATALARSLPNDWQAQRHLVGLAANSQIESALVP